MSVSGVSGSTFDGELVDEDFDPMFALVSVMADVAEEFVDWYDKAANDVEIASEWFIWFNGTVDGKSLDADNETLIAFTAWMDSIGFDYQKYFDFDVLSTGELMATGVKSGGGRNRVSTDQARELLALAVEEISTDIEQANVLTTGMIGNFNDGTQELISLINTLRNTGRGHIRS